MNFKKRLLLADLRDTAGDFEGCGCAVGGGHGEFYSTPEFDALEQEIK